MAPPTYDDDGLPATPPLLVINGGAALPPVKSKQYEVGGKLAFGRFNAGLALFQIDKPNSFVDPVTIVYGNYGTQRNRGVEITLDGEPVDGLRSEEHTSETQSLMRISYAVFCLKK